MTAKLEHVLVLGGNVGQAQPARDTGAHRGQSTIHYDWRPPVTPHPYLQPWLDNRRLEPVALDIARVRDRLAVARQHYGRAVLIREVIPDDHAFHLEKGDDALHAAAGALLHAHGVRTRGTGRSHETALDVAVACLKARRPDEAAELAPRAGVLRMRRNRSQYEMVEVVTKADCDDLFSVLEPILEAIEIAAYDLMGLPPPGSWPRGT
jgi:hypothetical protein